MPNNSFLFLSLSSTFLFDHFIGSKFRFNINAAAAEFISLLAGDRRFCNFFAGMPQNEDPLRPPVITYQYWLKDLILP